MEVTGKEKEVEKNMRNIITEFQDVILVQWLYDRDIQLSLKEKGSLTTLLVAML